ncbi:MAG: hypothetical protein ACO35E_09760 [Ilumatobacteraceae bacterium]|jgi:hypothetical protein
MIHPFDDLPLHQSSAPLLHVASDSAGLYDRYFFNGFSADGSVMFGVALGVYPNRQVMDAAFSIVLDGVQHNCRSSRRCSTDRTRTEVGAITVEVLEPMVAHRIVVRDHHGVSADVTMRAVSPVIEEPPFVRRVEGRPVMDYTRITQFGEWSGWITLDGARIDLADRGAVIGCRDRSWGVRGGTRGLPGPAVAPQFHWTWAPTLLGDACAHLAVNDDAEGRSWHRSGAVVERFPVGDGSVERVLDAAGVRRADVVSNEIVWRPGTRWAASMTAELRPWGAEPVRILFEPVARFQMSGLGYLHPEWDHGSWHGDLAETRDEIVLGDVDPLDPTMIHVQQVCRVAAGDRVGVAVLEQLVIGPHAPSGFASVLDGAS